VHRKPTAPALYQLQLGTPYMGRDPLGPGDQAIELGIELDPKEPFEPSANGCPGAWYRAAFVDSVWPLTRRRDGNGGRIQNPRFDAADWFAQEAALYFEAEEERALAYLERKRFEVQAAKDRERERKSKGGNRR